MTVYYVNLPLGYIAADARYLEMFTHYVRNGGLDFAEEQPEDEAAWPELGLELGMDAACMQNLPLSWHEALAARLRQAGARLAAHLPFFDLSPGSPDDFVRQASQDRLRAAFQLARIYAPDHMVGHPHYSAEAWGGNVKGWIERSAQAWSELCASWPGHPPLYLENTVETSPEPLAALMEQLPDATVGVCFDIGHWHSFAMGAERRNLPQWLAALAPWIRHLHLHDNDGSSDQHKGLGHGVIDFPSFFGLLRMHGVRPGVTLEPHDEGAFVQSLKYLIEHKDEFSSLQ